MGPRLVPFGGPCHSIGRVMSRCSALWSLSDRVSVPQIIPQCRNGDSCRSALAMKKLQQRSMDAYSLSGSSGTGFLGWERA